MRYLVDANFIIDVFERENTDSIDRLESILKNSGKLFYNGLIYTETLRVVLDDDTFLKLKSAFDKFGWLEVDLSIYVDAKRFSRYCRSQNIKGPKGRCEIIDIIHFITAKHNQLELLTNDGDMERLEQAWTDFKNTISD